MAITPTSRCCCFVPRCCGNISEASLAIASVQVVWGCIRIVLGVLSIVIWVTGWGIYNDMSMTWVAIMVFNLDVWFGVCRVLLGALSVGVGWYGVKSIRASYQPMIHQEKLRSMKLHCRLSIALCFCTIPLSLTGAVVTTIWMAQWKLEPSNLFALVVYIGKWVMFIVHALVACYLAFVVWSSAATQLIAEDSSASPHAAAVATIDLDHLPVAQAYRVT